MKYFKTKATFYFFSSIIISSVTDVDKNLCFFPRDSVDLLFPHSISQYFIMIHLLEQIQDAFSNFSHHCNPWQNIDWKKNQFREGESDADQLLEAAWRSGKTEAFSNSVVSHHNAADILCRYWFSLQNLKFTFSVRDKNYWDYQIC